MKQNYPYLKDSLFLKEMDEQHLQEQYAKIILLNWNEEPIKEIQGLITGGNINIAGNSNIRRTINLNMVVKEDKDYRFTEINNLISINKKVRVEIGFKNITDKYLEYKTIWYPQGIFVMINPSVSHSLSGTNISVSLKDKMCLLNGECGGTIAASTQFDEYETIDEEGNWIIQKPTINQIIRELVNHFGGEQLGKIIISDIDTRIKKVMKWVGNVPLYLKAVSSDNGLSYSLTTDESTLNGADIQTFYYGEDIGYIYSDFYYPTELIGNAGDTVCTILDKIKNTLGNYEYFYDIDGNFIFQEIKNYLNTSQAKIEIDNLKNDDYLLDMSGGKTVYKFTNNNIITSYSNNPQYHMIKNDFVVWGLRKSANGNSLPIRYHLAIDSKPEIGNTYECYMYTDLDDGLTKAKLPIIYDSIADMEKQVGMEGYLYKVGNDIYTWKDGEYHLEEDISLITIRTKDWRTELYLQGMRSEPLAIDSNYYYTELQNEWPKLYDVEQGKFFDEVIKTPSDIDFFLDMIDSTASIARFSVNNIGRRSIVINDNDINCIFESDIPDFVIIETGQEDTEKNINECLERNQAYIQVDTPIYSLLSIGGSQNSAYNRVRELLYQQTSYNESISIQAMPVYYLDANIRTEVTDIESNIFGDYIISTISIPLDINGTMTVSATRAMERF